MKLLKKAMVIAITVSMLATAFAVMPVSGAGNHRDTENEWLIDIEQAAVPATVTFYDVSWSPDGRYAMFVGVDSVTPSGCAYAYDVALNTWAQSMPNPPGVTDNQILRAVEWDPINSVFFVAGVAGASGEWFAAAVGGSISMYSHMPTFANMQIYDLGKGPANEMFACGADATGFATLLSIDLTAQGAGWTTRAGTVMASSVWAGLEYYATNNAVYLAGSSAGGTLSMLDYMVISVGTYTYAPATGIACAYTDIVWNAAKARLQVTAAGRGAGVAALFESHFPLVTTWNPIANPPQSINFNSLDVGYANKLICVGSDGTNGVIYEEGTTKRTNDALLALHPLYGVACRPTGIPMAMTAGSAFKFSYMAVDGGLTVNTVYPHISSIILRNKGLGGNIMNTAVDVDPGTNQNWYTLEVNGFHNLGSTEVDQVNVWMWFDGGATATDNSGNIGGVYGPNLGIQLRWTRGGIPDDWSIETLSVTNEWDLRDGDCGFSEAGTAFTATFAFEMNQQVWSALGGFTEPVAGSQNYDPGADGPTPEEQCTVNALNDADTWDIKAVAVADPAGANAQSPAAYDEFGLYMFTSMTSAGLPGAGYIGISGAPLTNNVASVTVGDWTYSANTPYDLYVHISDLVGGPGILATTIEIQGGQLNVGFTNFAGPGLANAQYLIGGNLAADGATPLQADIVTTTTTGTAGGIPVTWRCDIPNVPEASYVGTITYVLEHDP
jgi:hypothetical protein